MSDATITTRILAAVSCVALLAGCQELDVQNPNAPDRSRALATPGDVESLVGGAYRNIWALQHHVFLQSTVGAAQSVMADAHTASWGNFAMKYTSQEPRVALNNNPSFTYAANFEGSWYTAYAAIVAASDGLQALNEGLDLPEADRKRLRSFARFIQGMGHAYLALNYDRAFVIDETVNPETADLEMRSYREVMTAALGYLDQAIAVAENNSFTLPSNWIHGRPLDSKAFERLIHSYKARFRASWPRSPEEAGEADWAAVADQVEQGIQSDFSIDGDVGYSGSPWFAETRVYTAQLAATWARYDLRFLGKADVDGDYREWESTPASQRQPFLVNTPDARISAAVDSPRSAGKYMEYRSQIPFEAGRGTYHFSNYGDTRWPFFFTGPDPLEMTMDEMRLLEAEALLRTGQRSRAAELVNVTRVGKGELPPVTASEGVPQSETCVPRTIEGECGSLMEALQWEKKIETYQLTNGLAYWDDRRWGDLLAGTPVHFPVPGRELQNLQREIYTFGGDAGGTYASGSTSADLGSMSVDERIQYDLQQMEELWDLGDRAHEGPVEPGR